MKYLILAIFMTQSFFVQAQSSCVRLYEERAHEIAGEVDETTRVGNQIFLNPLSGQLGYSPGFEVNSPGPNWARDFLWAIEDGPEMTSFSITKGKKKEFLADMRKQLSSVCKMKDDPQYKNMRAFLKRLLEEGQFCPKGKTLKPTLFGSFKHFHKIAKSSLADADDFSLCDSKVVQDDSHRMIKAAPDTQNTPKNSHKSAVQQN